MNVELCLNLDHDVSKRSHSYNTISPALYRAELELKYGISFPFTQ